MQYFVLLLLDLYTFKIMKKISVHFIRCIVRFFFFFLEQFGPGEKKNEETVRSRSTCVLTGYLGVNFDPNHF